jgi:biopolymer transport protein ExbD
MADTDAQRDYPKEVIVTVSAEGLYSVNRVPVAGRGLEALAAALVEGSKASKDSVVIISADASAKHQAVVTVMEAARRTGLNQITFATQSSSQAGSQ